MLTAYQFTLELNIIHCVLRALFDSAIIFRGHMTRGAHRQWLRLRDLHLGRNERMRTGHLRQNTTEFLPDQTVYDKVNRRVDC